MTEDELAAIKDALDRLEGEACGGRQYADVCGLSAGPEWCDNHDAQRVAEFVPALLAEVERLRERLAAIEDDAAQAFEWFHQDGTPCPAGWKALTGECSTGGGRVFPRLRQQ